MKYWLDQATHTFWDRPKNSEIVDINAEDGIVTNEVPKTSINVTKQWENHEGTVLTGENIPSDATVTFTLYQDGQPMMVTREVGGQTETSPRTLKLNGSDATSGGTVTPDMDDYEVKWVAKFTNLPMYKDNGKKHVYTVKETGTWKGYYIDGSDTAAGGGKIVNKERVLTLDILKRIIDTIEPLENAEFTLDKIDGTSEAITKITGSGAVHQTVTTNAQGKAAFKDLPVGYYEITETKVPTGYVLTDKSTFYIHVKDKEGTTDENIYLLTPVERKAPNTWNEQAASYGSVKTFTYKTNLANAQALIENTPGAALPSTGGPGTRFLTLLGIMLIAFSGITLVRQRCQRGGFSLKHH